MIEPLTLNTQAILLMTAPLIAGRGEATRGLFSLSEYNRLARLLRDCKKEPADLLGAETGALLDIVAQPFGRDRVEALLARGFLLSQAVERWNARAIWVISRADSNYPKQFKARLREDAPPLLYGCGQIALLERGGLAVVGSRHANDEATSFAENVGRLAAQAHRSIISGGAKGIDRAAMRGALVAGGDVAGVMADSLERAALARDNREVLMDGRMALVSPYDPAAGFNVGHAMQRNKLIYALADAALVVTSELEKGGTWAGAIEQLEHFRFVQVFVRNGAKMSDGNAALLSRGARAWPDPVDAEEFGQSLIAAAEPAVDEPKQQQLALKLREEPAAYLAEAEVKAPQVKPSDPLQLMVERETSPAGQLLGLVREILESKLIEGMSDEEVASLLEVSKAQAKIWISKLVEEGFLEKTPKSKPVRYQAAKRLL